MSITIIKQGVLDTLQDGGRYGYQHLGINPGGAADGVAMAIANALVGNNSNCAVIEFHYPAGTLLFTEDALIALSGADFNARVNNKNVPLNTPVLIQRNSVLAFTGINKGCRCYMAVYGGFMAGDWLGSASTNIIATAGGFKGRNLLQGDVIEFKKRVDYAAILKQNAFIALPYSCAYPGQFTPHTVVRVCAGNEFALLTDAAKNVLLNAKFTITRDSNRMGYRLTGIPLQINMQQGLVSSGVAEGTVQLLPNGHTIILGADSQTTGGYPRLAHIATPDMHLAAQLQPGQTVQFSLIDTVEAERLLIQQRQYLLQLQDACNLRLQQFFATHAIH